ncbi:MAG: hypothetical protein AB7S36_06975 [Planctomycetota bacterium]
MHAHSTRLSGLSGLLLISLLAAASLAGATGCANEHDVRGGGTTVLENNPRWQEVLAPDVQDETQLLSYHLIQVGWDAEHPRQRTDLGYLRQERLIVRVKPWDERNANGFIVRLPGSFKHAVRDKDGKVTYWEAVDKTFHFVLDLSGRPVGQIDEFGTVKKWNPSVNQMIEVGSGTAEQAALMLFDLKESYRFDRTAEDIVHRQPQIYMQLMDSTLMGDRRQQITENRFSNTGVITDISEDALAKISLESPEQAAGFRVGDRLRFIDVENPEYARSLASSPIASVISIEDNVITTTLDARGEFLRGRFESGKLGIIDEYERDKLYNNADRIWNR